LPTKKSCGFEVALQRSNEEWLIDARATNPNPKKTSIEADIAKKYSEFVEHS
jgi:hypothetical protein